MKNAIRYGEYTGHFEYDDEAGIFHGEILGIDDVVTFEGKSLDELKQAFRDSVAEYLDVCARAGKKPDEPRSGEFAEDAAFSRICRTARREPRPPML
jgi:predicted HicB family RNase H-like nuclease